MTSLLKYERLSLLYASKNKEAKKFQVQPALTLYYIEQYMSADYSLSYIFYIFNAINRDNSRPNEL